MAVSTLAIVKGPGAGERYDLGDITVIGRYPFCDIRLDLSSVSRQHARVVREKGSFFLEDLNSQNGTFVNSERVERRRQLKHNDRINIHQVVLLYLDENAGDNSETVVSPVDAHETRPHVPNILEAVNATSDSSISTNADEKWRASLSLLRSLGQTLDVDEMLSRLLDDLFRIFSHADRGYILLLEPDGKLVMQALREDGGTNAAEALGPVDRSLAEKVIAQGEGVLCLDEDYDDEQSVLEMPIRSIMCTPLISPLDKPLGVLYIDTKQEHKRFSTDDLELLVGVAMVASQSIAFARQHQASLRAHEQHTLELRKEIDIRKQVEDELRRSNVELQDFAYAASHDLQEPLRAVSGFVQLLEQTNRDNLDEQSLEFIQHAVNGTQRMKTLIDDLLAYSRVQTRATAFRSTACNEVLQAALANLAVPIHETQAQVTADDLPTLDVDTSQMMQLLQNLVGNALKFHGDEVPIIHVAAEQSDSGWVFSVRDRGIGIAAEHQQRIFKMFQRLHSQAAIPGSGLGLAICKRIVDRHGGRLWVESEVDQGSTFYFSIATTAP